MCNCKYPNLHRVADAARRATPLSHLCPKLLKMALYFIYKLIIRLTVSEEVVDVQIDHIADIGTVHIKENWSV